MEFWALEHADDGLKIVMACVIILFGIVGGIIELIDLIKRIKNK